MLIILRKKLRTMLMGKAVKMKFKRALAPYTKYNKIPFRYSPGYYKWRADRLAGRKPDEPKVEKHKYQEVAE